MTLYAHHWQCGGASWVCRGVTSGAVHTATHHCQTKFTQRHSRCRAQAPWSILNKVQQQLGRVSQKQPKDKRCNFQFNIKKSIAHCLQMKLFSAAGWSWHICAMELSTHFISNSHRKGSVQKNLLRYVAKTIVSWWRVNWETPLEKLADSFERPAYQSVLRVHCAAG